MNWLSDPCNSKFPGEKENFSAGIYNFLDEKIETPGGILLKSRLDRYFNGEEVR
jgi:hypothetical protein